MNRWISDFQNHAFQKSWKELLDLSSNTTLQDETITTDVQELARFKKGITYINNLMKAADPELIPKNIWNLFNEQTAQALGQIQHYNEDKNITFLIQANEHLDNLLTYIKPYITSEESYAQAAMDAFKSYSKTINDHICRVEENINSDVKSIKKNKSNSELHLEKMNGIHEKIQQLEKDILIGDESKKSLKNEILALLDDGIQKQASINEFHNKLTRGNEHESSIVLQIEEAKNKVIANSQLTETTVKSVEKLTNDFRNFYVNIFGDENEHIMNNVEGGLKKLLDDKVTEIIHLKDDHDRIYNEKLQHNWLQVFSLSF